MRSFNIRKYVWFDVSGIPGNTVIYIASSVQKLKTGKKIRQTQPDSLKSSYPRCFRNALHKVICLIFCFICFLRIRITICGTPSTDTTKSGCVLFDFTRFSASLQVTFSGQRWKQYFCLWDIIILRLLQRRTQFSPNVSINNVLSALRDDRKLHWIKNYQHQLRLRLSLLFFFLIQFFMCLIDSLQFLENNIFLKSKILRSCKADQVTFKGRNWFLALCEQMLSSFHYILTSYILHIPFNC